MGKVGLAFRAFWRALTDASMTAELEAVLARKQPSAPTSAERQTTAEKPQEPKPKPPPKPARSDALTLLASLQREARFVDFVREDVSGYSDAQVGAAARDVHRGCREVIDRMFDLAPSSEAEEGADIEVPDGFDAGCYQLTGNVAGEPPFNGQLVHHGWQARKCDLPTFNGSKKAAQVVAPIEVELK